MISYCLLRRSKSCSYCILHCLHSCACLPHTTHCWIALVVCLYLLLVLAVACILLSVSTIEFGSNLSVMKRLSSLVSPQSRAFSLSQKHHQDKHVWDHLLSHLSIWIGSSRLALYYYNSASEYIISVSLCWAAWANSLFCTGRVVTIKVKISAKLTQAQSRRKCWVFLVFWYCAKWVGAYVSLDLQI